MRDELIHTDVTDVNHISIKTIERVSAFHGLLMRNSGCSVTYFTLAAISRAVVEFRTPVCRVLTVLESTGKSFLENHGKKSRSEKALKTDQVLESHGFFLGCQ